MNMAPTLQLLVFTSIAPAPELSFLIAWLRLLFDFTHNVSQFEWKMKYIKYTKPKEYTKFFLSKLIW